MANIGTQIHNQVLKPQGFDYHEFDATGIVSTKTGLKFLARFEPLEVGRRTVTVLVDRNNNNTYDIKFTSGMTTPDTVAKSVAEADLATTLTAILRKEKSRA